MASYGDNRYAPPGANVADIAAPSGVVLASRWRRLFGSWIDWFAVYLLALLLATAGFSALWTQPKPAAMAQFFFAFNVQSLLSELLFLLVNGYLLVARGQTIGKVALGMRILRPDGSKVSASRLVGLRYGVGFLVSLIPAPAALYGLIDSLLIFRESRRCLHDVIADTIVVRT
ncbi:MAG TPA: RDD family protein [Burkholderiaceae bacterium]|jgi:uncharacterized RDD family membrane protein YckC|nr:RDD family protein [Burkholderiaceae bacterium]